MGPGYIPIPYLNTSAEPVPPFGVIQFTGSVDTATGTKIFAVKAKKPSSTDGVFAIDWGQGALAAGSAGAYGQCYIPVSHVTWAKFNGTTPPSPWMSEIGPVANQWYMNSSGSGYWYAGAHDTSDQWILVNKVGGGSSGPIVGFSITTPDCDNGTSLATVVSVTDGATGVSVGDSIQVCDTLGCWLLGGVLGGRRGFAQRQTGIDCTPQSGTGTGTGTGSVITNPWAIISLCPLDVVCG